MHDVKILGKDDRNKFDGYDFVSIDKFLSLVNPICAKHGLCAIPSMVGLDVFEKPAKNGNMSSWGKYSFEIVIGHKSGESLKMGQFVTVPMNGAQASGSAQSYAIKQAWRAILCIPTGDKDDVDLMPTEPISPPPAAPTEEEKAQMRLDFANKIATALREEENIAKRADIIAGKLDKIKTLKDGDADAYQVIVKACEETRTHLETEEAK